MVSRAFRCYTHSGSACSGGWTAPVRSPGAARKRRSAPLGYRRSRTPDARENATTDGAMDVSASSSPWVTIMSWPAAIPSALLVPNQGTSSRCGHPVLPCDRPAWMDADGDGAPCETVFDAEVVDAVWAGGAISAEDREIAPSRAAVGQHLAVDEEWQLGTLAVERNPVSHLGDHDPSA